MHCRRKSYSLSLPRARKIFVDSRNFAPSRHRAMGASRTPEEEDGKRGEGGIEERLEEEREEEGRKGVKARERTKKEGKRGGGDRGKTRGGKRR